MIAIVDVHYGNAAARAGCVVIADWIDSVAIVERASEVDGVAEYVPAELYKRELPALLAVLDGVAAEIVVVDGYVWIGEGRAGLGAHLQAARGGIVVGIAKNELPGAPGVPVIRGDSAKPLQVSAIGVDAEQAARWVAAMHGEHRLPTMVVRADHVARALR